MHPPARREFTLVLKAYLDASNEGTGDPVAVVAGCVADENQWAAFESVWVSFLGEFELTRFHSSHFWARKEPPYSRWSDAKWEKAKGDVCRILGGLRIIGVGAAVSLKAFNEWRATSDLFYHHDPYYFCLQYTLGILIRQISQHPLDEGITIYIDQDKGRESLGQEIAKWHRVATKASSA